MTLDIQPFDAALGAEVRGVDLAQTLDDATFGAVEQAYNDHSILLFRDQTIDEAQQLAFSRRFGDLEVHVLDQYLHPEHPEILIVSNVMDGDRHIGIYDAGRYWHTDLSYMSVPSRGSLLYAIEVPHDSAGEPLGDTLFASTAAAYDALSEDMKSSIADLKAEFSLANRHAKFGRGRRSGRCPQRHAPGKGAARRPTGYCAPIRSPDARVSTSTKVRRRESWAFPRTRPAIF